MRMMTINLAVITIAMTTTAMMEMIAMTMKTSLSKSLPLGAHQVGMRKMTRKMLKNRVRK